MAELMGLSHKVKFANQSISLDGLTKIGPTDLIICQNLLHHAGSIFDIEIVKERGWISYASDWLKVLREKSKYCIFACGFKDKRPSYWKASRIDKPGLFLSEIEKAGWSCIYNANVQDIFDFGVARANGMRTAHPQNKLRRYATSILRSAFFNVTSMPDT